MGLLPRRVQVERTPEEARVLDIEGADADQAFEALSSETARRILAVVYEEPSTPPEVRERVGTSLQNVHYHLDKLERADLIEPAGVGYSEKGNEMTVFAPKSEAVVLFAGRQQDRSRLKGLLTRVFGLYAVLAAVTGLLWVGRELLRPDSVTTAGGGGGPSADGAEFAAQTTEVAAGGAGIDPLVLFFLGGAVTVAGLAVYWYVTGR